MPLTSDGAGASSGPAFSGPASSGPSSGPASSVPPGPPEPSPATARPCSTTRRSNRTKKLSTAATVISAAGNTEIRKRAAWSGCGPGLSPLSNRSEEHTSELQSRGHLVCRLLLEKKKGCNKKSNQPRSEGEK